MSPTRCRITVHLPHRLLWVHRCVVLRVLGLPQTGEVPRVWEWYFGRTVAEVPDVRVIEAEVDGDAATVEADVREALWQALAPHHRGLVHPTPETSTDPEVARLVLRIKATDVRPESAQPAPLTRITEAA